MLSLEGALAVKRMLTEGVPVREISRQTGVSRATIGRIRAGTWSEARARQTESGVRSVGGVALPVMNAAHEWCGGCRAMVKMPCLACQVRAIPRLLTNERSE